MAATDCPVIAMHGLLGKKWSLALLDTVAREPGIRFNRLSKTLLPISPKILANRLAQLEKFGVLQKKTSHPKNGKQSAFSLTTQGQELYRAFQSLKKWGIRYRLVPSACEHTSCAACQAFFAKK